MKIALAAKIHPTEVVDEDEEDVGSGRGGGGGRCEGGGEGQDETDEFWGSQGLWFGVG